MRKNLHEFSINFKNSTCYGDFWQAWAYEGGHWHTTDDLFFGYTKSEIKRILHQKLLNEVFKYEKTA